MSLRAVRSPLAPKMTMEQGSSGLRSAPRTQTGISSDCSIFMAETMAQRAGKFNVCRSAIFPPLPEISRAPRNFFAKSFRAHMKAKIIITPKKAVVDPQGITVLKALEHMGHTGIKAVHVGKYLEIELDGSDKESARKALDEAAHKFLSNPLIEDYRIEIE